MAGEWDVVSTSPAPAAPKAGADPWAVVSHVDAPAPSMSDNALSAVRSSIPYGLADIAGTGAANLGGKILAGGHGLAKLVSTPGSFSDRLDAAADTVNADRAAMRTEANSPGAKTIQQGLGYVAKPFEAVAAPLDNAISHAGPGISTAVPALSEGIQDVAGLSPLGKLSEAVNAGRGAAEVAAEGGAKPVVGTGQQAVQTGRSAGFKFTPAAVESRDPAAAVAGEVPKSFATDINDRRAINLHNAARSTELAGEQIGQKGATTLSKQNFDDARQPHFDTYKATGNAMGSGLTGSPDFVPTLEGRLADTSPTQLKGPVVQQTQRIVAAARSGNLSGPQMIKDISWLRANGGRSVAGALEDEVQNQLAKTPAGSQQLDAFREARTGLAQIHQLQQASPGGIVNPQVLADFDRKNPGVLTGNLKLIAQSAAAAPQDFRLPSGVQPNSSPVSKPTWAGFAKAALGKVAKVTMPGRFDIQSDAFQNRFGREASPTESTYFRDLGKRPGAPSEAFALSPGPGKAGVEPLQRGMELPQGGPPREQLGLTAPEGEVGMTPRQLGMEVAQGPAPREQLGLAPPEGNVGVNPVQLGMEMAQGRPMPEQKLGLAQTPAGIEPHQPSLLGHEGTPEGGSRKSAPKAKKRGKD